MSEQIKVMISEEDVDKKIRELGAAISKDYEGEELVVICVLKGAAYFACELTKHITVPVTIDFMATSSYGSGTESSGDVKIKKDLDFSVAGKNILIAEDIIDSGNTLKFLRDLLSARGAKSFKVCALLDKPERRTVDAEADYVGFTIPNKYVVGYGLDYDQKYRNLPYIAELIL